MGKDLSTEVKAKETHEKAVGYFKISEQYGYKFIMEVKKIRDDRYYKELGFNTFEEYCNQAWGFSRRWIDSKIQAASQLNESDFENFSSHFGVKKTFLLATMEDEQREQATTKGIPTDEGYKSIDKATQKEINEYKRNAEEATKRAQEAEQQLKEEQSKPPEVIEKVVEIDNTDHKKINLLSTQLQHREEEISELEEELQQLKENTEEYDQLKKNLMELHRNKEEVEEQIESATSISTLVVDVEEFIQERIGGIKYTRAVQERLDSYVVQKNIEVIGNLLIEAGQDVLDLLPKNNKRKIIDIETIE